MSRFVVCYDISSNSKRVKVMKKLKDKGFHAQLSFFEVEGSSVKELHAPLKNLISSCDRLTVVRLSSRGKIKRIGGLLEGMEWVL
ncbi:MAG: CRISPR-associated endonuclease Cas2 [Aquificae bacterium]|nr:CRISPR-associated endonuclease Cas2 [Aquificota bacterium]